MFVIPKRMNIARKHGHETMFCLSNAVDRMVFKMRDFALKQSLFLEVSISENNTEDNLKKKIPLGAVATKRFCSSRHMDNQCIEVKYPQDEKMYYSCTYTCSSDGCNGSSHVSLSFSIFFMCLIIRNFFVFWYHLLSTTFFCIHFG